MIPTPAISPVEVNFSRPVGIACYSVLQNMIGQAFSMVRSIHLSSQCIARG